MNIKRLSIAAVLAGSVVAVAQDPVPVVTPGGTKVQIYGRLELNAAYEDDITNGLWSANAPAAAQGDAQGRTSLSAARTRLGLNLEGPSKDGEPSLKGRFEADFAGNSTYSNFNANTGFRVRQSWGSVSFKDIGLTLLFGQTDDVVNPIDPPSINPSSLNGAGNLGNRRPQIRITQALGPVEIAVAATHDRTYGYTPEGATDAVSDANAPSSPGFQGRLGVKVPATWAGEKANLAVGLGGLYAKNEAANADDENRYKRPEPSYGFMADLSLPLIDILTLTGEFFLGQNLNRYGDASLGQSRAYGKVTTSSGGTKDLGGINSIGWWTGLAAKLPASLSAAAGVGGENLDDDSKRTGRAESNLFVFANLGYNFTSAAKLTFEYLTYSTDYTTSIKSPVDGTGSFKSEDASLNRFELNFRYDFK
jgi:hypothetical protein